MGFFACFKKILYLLFCLETSVEFGLHFTLRTIGIKMSEKCAHSEIRFAFESIYLAFALNDESHGNALHPSG